MTRRRNGAAAPSPKPRRRAVYTRKSTAMDLERAFASSEAPRACREQYIAARAHDGWQSVPERDDDGGFTGANIERPAFERPLADTDAGKLDVVVVYEVDRLSRSLLDFAQVMARFNKTDEALVSEPQAHGSRRRLRVLPSLSASSRTRSTPTPCPATTSCTRASTTP